MLYLLSRSQGVNKYQNEKHLNFLPKRMKLTVVSCRSIIFIIYASKTPTFFIYISFTT